MFDGKMKALTFSYDDGVGQDVRLIEMFNNNIIPVVYEQGSLGASGDLSPLAHMCLPLIGLGHVEYEGEESALYLRAYIRRDLNTLPSLTRWALTSRSLKAQR